MIRASQLTALLIFGWASVASAQQIPTPTEAGKAALADLIAFCQDQGGLKQVDEPRSEAGLKLADNKQLSDAVATKIKMLTPALRDALIAQLANAESGDTSALAALLLEIGKQRNDDLAQAVGTYFQGRHAETAGKLEQALAIHGTAAKLSRAAGSLTWQAAAENRSGAIFFSTKKFETALSHFQLALKLRRQFGGDEHPDVAHSLNNLGACYEKLAQYDKAMKAHQQSLELRKKLFGETANWCIQSLRNIANLHEAQKQYADAISLQEQVLTIRKQRPPAEQQNVVATLDDLVRLQIATNKLSEARATNEEALTLEQQLFGDKSRTVALRLLKLGRLCRIRQRDYAAAEQYYLRAVTVLRSLYANKSRPVGLTLRYLGHSRYFQRKYDDAAKTYAEALECFDAEPPSDNRAALLRDLGDVAYVTADFANAAEYYRRSADVGAKVYPEKSSILAGTLLSLGRSLRRQNKYEEANQVFSQALDQYDQSTPSQGRAQLLDEMGYVAFSQADFAAAARLYQESADIGAKVYEETSTVLLSTLKSLGNTFNSLKQFDKARSTYERVLKAQRALHGDTHADVAESLNNIGYTYYNQKRYKESRSYFEQALAMRRQVLPDDHVDTGWSIRNLGNYYYATAEYDRALQLYSEADDLFRRIAFDSGRALCLADVAFLHKRRSNYAQAISIYEQVLEIRTKLHGESHAETIETIRRLGNSYYSAQRYDKALLHLQRADALLTKLYGEDHAKLATTAIDLGDVYRAQQDFTKCEAQYRRALAIREKVFGTKSAPVADSIRMLGHVHFYQNEFGQALTRYEESLAIYQELRGADNLDVARLQLDIGDVKKGQQQYDEAMTVYEQALATRRKNLGENHGDVAYCYKRIGTLLQTRGDHDRAMEFFQSAARVYTKLYGAESADVARTLNDIGYCLLALGQVDDAMKQHLHALDMLKQSYGEGHPELGWTLNQIGYIYESRGEFNKARDYYQSAFAARERSLGKGHPVLITNALSIARSFKQLGDTGRAISLYFENVQEPDTGLFPAESIYVYFSRGAFWASLDLYDSAIKEYRKALQQAESTFGALHQDTIRAHDSIGWMYRQQGKNEEALREMQLALAAFQRVPNPNRVMLSELYWDIALVHSQQEDYERSLEFSDRALKTLRTADAPDRPISLSTASDFVRLPMTARIARYRSWVFEHTLTDNSPLSDWKSAAKSYALAASLTDVVRGQVIETDSSKLVFVDEAATILAGRLRVFQHLYEQDGKAEYLVSAFNAAEQATARVYSESFARARVLDSAGVDQEFRVQLRQAAQHWQQLEKQIYEELSLPLAKQNSGRIRELVDERARLSTQQNELKLQIKQKFPKFATLDGSLPCTLAEARACLHENETALIYFMRPDRSFLLLLEGPVAGQDITKAVGLYPLASGKEIAELVDLLADTDTLEHPQRFRSVRAEAWDTLIEPVADRIRGRDLLIIPCAALCRLPFEMLAEPVDSKTGDRRFLIEAHAVRYAPSLTVLHFVRQWEQTRHRPDRSLWALGDPIYEQTDSRLQAGDELTEDSSALLEQYAQRMTRGDSPGELKHRRLRYSGVELRRIARILKASDETLKTGSAATEEVIKQASIRGELAQARYVHLACHGILGFDTGYPQCLLLSLVGNTEEDGFLQLDEVMNLKLNADLVTLSACSSGRGTLHIGEGIRGLAQAFLHAGSRGVLCSLWQVEDQSTADLMAQFYKELNQGASATDALRRAKLHMIQEGTSPLNWAPFVLFGADDGQRQRVERQDD